MPGRCTGLLARLDFVRHEEEHLQAIHYTYSICIKVSTIR
jgi:hypothetical protein